MSFDSRSVNLPVLVAFQIHEIQSESDVDAFNSVINTMRVGTKNGVVNLAMGDQHATAGSTIDVARTEDIVCTTSVAGVTGSAMDSTEDKERTNRWSVRHLRVSTVVLLY